MFFSGISWNALSAGREKEGDLEFESPSTDKCKTSDKGNDVITNVISVNQQELAHRLRKKAKELPHTPTYWNTEQISRLIFGTITDASGCQSMNLHNNYHLSILKTCTYVFWRLISLEKIYEIL